MLYLALKVFQGNREILPQDKKVWQDKLAEICTDLILGKKVDGVLPDFKGFDKKVYGSNHFKPRYDVALDRRPISFSVADNIEVNYLIKDWSHKVRLAFNKFLTQIEKVSEQIRHTRITTQSLPLRADQTNIYKELIKNAATFESYDVAAKYDLDPTLKTRLDIHIRKWLFNKKKSDLGYLLAPLVVESTPEIVGKRIMKAIRDTSSYSKRLRSSLIDDEIEVEEIYGDAESLIETLSQLKINILIGLEMGLDPQDYFEEVNDFSILIYQEYFLPEGIVVA